MAYNIDDKKKKKAVSSKTDYFPALANQIRKEAELIYNELIKKGHSEFTARMYADDYTQKSMKRLGEMAKEKGTPEIKRDIIIDKTGNEVSELTADDIREIDTELGKIGEEAKNFVKKSTAITDTDRYKERLIKKHGSWENVPNSDKAIYRDARKIEQKQHEASITDLDMSLDPSMMAAQEEQAGQPKKTKRQENVEGAFSGKRAKRIEKAKKAFDKLTAPTPSTLPSMRTEAMDFSPIRDTDTSPDPLSIGYNFEDEENIMDDTPEYDPLSRVSPTDFDLSGRRTVESRPVTSITEELSKKEDRILNRYKNVTEQLENADLSDKKRARLEKRQQKLSDRYDATDDAEREGGQGVDTADVAGAAGGALTSLVNLGIALTSEDEVPRSPFADYAKDTLRKLDESKQFAGRVKSMQEQDLLMQEQGARRRSRDTARGIGTFRAQELGIHISSIGAKRGIDTDYYNRMESIYGKEAETLLRRDEVVMGDEVRRQELIQKERDAYRTAVGEAVSGVGTFAQQQAKIKNTEKENKMKMKMAYSIGKYGTPEDYADYFDF